jgi:small-conductance mechanosensitive channel
MIASIAEAFRSFLGNYSFLDIDIFNNKMADYVVFLVLFLILFLALRIFRSIILNKIKNFIRKIGYELGNTLVLIIDTIKAPFYWFLAFYISVNILSLNPVLFKIITGILLAWVSYQVVKAFQILIDYALQKVFINEKDQGTQNAILTIGKITKSLLWILAVLTVLSNLGVNITSVIAGLGIGGIAVALALQNILNDLFSSFAIYFDKPFVAGDFIIVGEHMGVVEKIGIKTTRIRALQGEEIVISNKELTSTRIQNFKKMQKRRVVFAFGVVYGTSLEKLKKIPLIVGEIIKSEKLAELDRVHFVKFDDSALTFEVVYYLLSADYNDYMDVNQNILLSIKENFEKENISMAFPTQTLYIRNNTSN